MKATFDRADESRPPQPPSPPRADASDGRPRPASSAAGSSRTLAPDAPYLPTLPTPILSVAVAAAFQNAPEAVRDPPVLIYMSGNASRTRPPNMSDLRSPTSSEQGRPASRGRSHSQPTNPVRRPPLRPPFQGPHAQPLYPLDTAPASAAPSPSFHPIPSPYPPSYAQHGYVAQYAMSPQPPVNMSQYAYAHHPGLHAPDTPMHPPQNQLLGYSPNTLMPLMQPHTPVYQGFPGHSPEGSSSSSHSFTPTPGASAIFSPHSHPSLTNPHSPALPSPPPHTPLLQQGSGPHHPPPLSHSASYTGQSPYAPLRYPTPPFPYPSHSFPHSPSLYTSTYPSPYAPHSYAPEPPPEGQGTWWYVPPRSSQYDTYHQGAPYSMGYSMSPREVEPYPQPGPSSMSSPVFAMSPRQPPAQYPPAQMPTHAVPEPPPLPPPASQLPPPQFSRAPSPGSSARTRQQQKQPEAGVTTPSGTRPAAERSRRPHHPQPPAQRSEWVMWVGNVPSDTTHDELWRFLNQEPSAGTAAGPSSAAAGVDAVWGGVLSIFLISRSNCAFVNFQSETHLLAAIRHFNGQPLRPGDPRCPRLVCRVRAREDDVKAGVGGQRGAGLHVRWIRDQKEKAREAARAGQEPRSPTSSDALTTPSSSPSDAAPLLASLSLGSDDESGRRHRGRPAPHSSSSGSYASTSSSILMQYFPKRFFILKSLTQKDLDISVEKGLWATQRHNEGTLDQAFRTSKDVYLIFGVNKSGEFYGYARMAGPVTYGEHRVSWTSPAESPLQRRMSRAGSSQGSSPPVARRDAHARTFFSPAEQRYEESPQPLSSDAPLPPSSSAQQLQVPQAPYDEGATPRSTQEGHSRNHLSAPPEMHRLHRGLSALTGVPRQAQTLLEVPAAQLYAPTPQLPDDFELDPTAPQRHIRERSASELMSARGDVSEAGRKFDWDPVAESPLEPVTEEEERASGRISRSRTDGAPAGEEAEANEGPGWGEPFRVQWIRTERLPFYRTRHLRNPWNHDREIKVSRDGTELEPSVGQALLDEWDRPAPPTEGGAGPSDEPPPGEGG
ncbi:hypothetical protein IEO21_04286 [Rhodonia placenta]|uniref:YTH domain-containing protein n=1 Tax=Rhodonia placenta TaxID=104341 RepID=A0A8H7P411_9APHY|nr:hypothetical protein IEO21_04286 [Postia placenta]